MKALLKQEHLRNFKNVIYETFYPAQITEVCGTNATGKTTLFDAFTFCLYGKDSKGCANFGFKHRGKDGKVVHKAEYAVKLVFDVDGTERTFERVVTEKWSKDVLKGHETAYYVDNIKCTMKDYNAAVAKIAIEDVLRMLTDVFYFTSLSADTKKAMLLRMAYGTSDSEEADKMATAEVLAKMPTFAAFVDELNCITLREFNAKTQADINRIKAELNDIPLKIAAKQEAMPAEEDWEGLQAVIDENKKAMEEIDKQIANESARVAGSEQKKNALKTELSNLTLELVKAENAVRTKVENDEREKRQAVMDAGAEYGAGLKEYNYYSDRVKVIKQQLEADKKVYDGGVAEIQAKIAELEEQANVLRAKFVEIRDNKYTYEPNELECPTCHRPYDIEKLKEHKLAENVSVGRNIMNVLIPQLKETLAVAEKNYTEKKATVEKSIAECEEAMKLAREKIDAAYKKKEAIAFVPADVNALCKANPTYNDISAKIEAVRMQINAWPAEPAESELKLEKKALGDKITALQMQLGQRNTRATIAAQIEQLEAKQRDLNAQLAELEKKHDTAKEFQKTKDRELLAKVNGLFTMVTWDFVTEQLNGNDRIACNCYIDGKPYGECNHALQVNGGLDIINAISRSNDIYLPIFIDNAESVVDYIHTDSQMILLKVDENAKQLTFNIK